MTRHSTAWVLAAALIVTIAVADDDAAVQAAIRNNYAAYSSFDEARYRKTTKDDFLLLEHGDLIDREWLESTILRREAGQWKMALLHSTRVSHPAGAADMKQFAIRYSAAWSSQDPARVAAFHAENGSLTINAGTPAAGRAGITEAVRAFMTAYPDMVVELDRLEHEDGKYRYHWRFRGTNTGPGGTGQPVRTSGYEEWTMGTDGLIATSQGHYDAADWDRQARGQP